MGPCSSPSMCTPTRTGSPRTQRSRRTFYSNPYRSMPIKGHSTIYIQIIGMGVFSFARYDDNFYSRSYAGRLKKGIKPCQGDYSMFEGYYSPPITSTLLLRSCKTVTHEIGHIFGVKHCQWIQCVMQGSNHLEESDRRPLDLCPVYLRKLQSAIGFKIANRYKTWIEEEGAASPGQPTVSQSDSEPHCPKPTLAFQNSRQWLRRCLEILEKVIF